MTELSDSPCWIETQGVCIPPGGFHSEPVEDVPCKIQHQLSRPFLVAGAGYFFGLRRNDAPNAKRLKGPLLVAVVKSVLAAKADHDSGHVHKKTLNPKFQELRGVVAQHERSTRGSEQKRKCEITTNWSSTLNRKKLCSILDV
jgi:hypothetical protein